LTRSTWAAVAIAAIATASGCAESTGTPGAIETRDPVATFAPVIAVDARERRLPIAAGDFISHATLRWRDGDCGDETVAAGLETARPSVPPLDAARLGGKAPPYSHRPGRPPGCTLAKRFSTNGYTRPYDPLRANDIPIDEGFYLDLDDRLRQAPAAAARRSRTVTAPAYFELRRERHRGRAALRITYWLLFASQHGGGPSASSRSRGPVEGDWERLSVLLRPVGAGAYLPLSVRYGDEDGRPRYAEVVRDVPWRAARRWNAPDGRRARPLALAARGSHRLSGGGVDGSGGACRRCVLWLTWRDLHPARDQPWYGYGGAWGEAGGPGAAAGLGPSPWSDVEPFELG
jgi:hypothetical protein